MALAKVAEQVALVEVEEHVPLVDRPGYAWLMAFAPSEEQRLPFATKRYLEVGHRRICRSGGARAGWSGAAAVVSATAGIPPPQPPLVAWGLGRGS